MRKGLVKTTVGKIAPTPQMEWVSLHTHSTFSYGDGFGPVRNHVERAHELGMKAIALTEHGNLSSHVQLEQECKKLGLKAIFGLEAYVAPPDEKRKFHQTIIAKDEEGLRNLNRLVTESWRTLGTTSKTKFPTVHWDNLRRHSRGLIVLSGCADSLLSCTLLGGKSLGDQRLAWSKANYQNALRVARQYQKVFGVRYFLEVQRFPGLPRTCILNPAFAQISEDTGIRLVGTADSHYCHARESKLQTILHAAHRGSTVEKTEASWEYDIFLTFPTSDEEIFRDLKRTGLTAAQAKSAISSTATIARSCTAQLPKNKPIRYPISENDWVPWK